LKSPVGHLHARERELEIGRDPRSRNIKPQQKKEGGQSDALCRDPGNATALKDTKREEMMWDFKCESLRVRRVQGLVP